MSIQRRVRDHRRRMRARGYRPVQIWVPDVRSAEFANEARRQAALVAANDSHSDDQDFIEAVSADWDDDPGTSITGQSCSGRHRPTGPTWPRSWAQGLSQSAGYLIARCRENYVQYAPLPAGSMHKCRPDEAGSPRCS